MPTSLRALLFLAAATLAACGGVKLGGRTVVAPIARPAAAPAADAAPAIDVAAPAADAPSIGGGGDMGRGLGAQDRVTAGPAVLAARAATGCFVADRRPHDRAAPSDGPVDPWRAVDGGRPRVLPHAITPWLDPGGATCDAAHDHCLRDCTWLVSTDVGAQRWLPEVHERDATADGWSDLDPALPFVAFRSAPATRANLDVGATALARTDPPRPGATWTYGTVEAIDWAEGTVRLHGHRAPYPLAFTRAALLRFTGAEVERLE